MPQLRQKPPDLDDDFQPIVVKSTVIKSPKPPDIDDEPSMDELLADAKLSLTPGETTKPVKANPRGFMESFSDSMSPLTEPLTDYFSRQSNKAADLIDNPRLDRSEPEAMLSGFKAGATQGLGKVADSLTSPINLAIAILTGGQSLTAKVGLPKVAQALTYGVKGLSGAMTGAGAKHTAEAETIPEALWGVAEMAGGGAGMMHTPSVAKAKALPVKLPRESPILTKPYNPAELTDPNYNAGIGDPELAGTVPPPRTSGVAVKPKVRVNLDGTWTDQSTQQPFDPSSLKDLKRTQVVPEGVDPLTGEIVDQSVIQELDANRPKMRSTTKRMGTPDLGPTPEALASKPPDLPETAVSEPPATFESWLDRLKSDRGVLNVTEIADAIAGREPEGTSVKATPEPTDAPALPDAPVRRSNQPVSQRMRAFFDSLQDRDIQDYVNETEGFTGPTAINNRNYALDVLDDRARGVYPEGSPSTRADATRRYQEGADSEFAPTASTTRQEPLFPNRAGGEFLESMSDESITDFIRRQSGTEGYSYDTGQRILRHAQDILDSRAAGEISRTEVDPTPQTERSNRQFAENQRRNSEFGDPPPDPNELFDSGVRYPTTEDAVHDLSTSQLQEFIADGTNRRLTSYAEGVLQERTRSFDEAGNLRSRDSYEPLSVGNESDWNNILNPREPTTYPWETTEHQRRYPVEPRPLDPKDGLTIDQLEATKKTSALERLGKIIGEDRAQQLASGDKSIEFSRPAQRYKGKKIHPSTARSWADWGDSQLKDFESDAGKPGLTIEPHGMHSSFPKALEMVYRDAKGDVIGTLITDLKGEGISTLAVSSKLGLRRGKVAFEMLKEAFDRGITEPSGTTSDFTNNLIERVKRLVKSEKGELNLDEIYKAINELIDKVSGSKFGRAVGGKLKQLWNDESGSADFSFGRGKETARKQAYDENTAANKRTRAEVDARKQIEFDENEIKLYKESDDPSPDVVARLEDRIAKNKKLLEPDTSRGISKLIKDETGSANVKDPLDALKELFEKSKKGALTPEEMAQAKKLAKEQPAAPVAPEVGPASSREYLEGKSQVDTGPLIPENAGVTSITDPVESLSQRLKKAVDEAGQPNAVAPEEISKLIDEGTQVLNQIPGGPEKPGIIRQILGANKALLTSWDVSAPGRQGKSLIFNKAWWTSIDDMAKAWGSKEAADLINQSIVDHPSGYFKPGVDAAGKATKSFAEKIGLELASTEEMFNAKLGQQFEKYSLIGKSSRAHTAFLNKLRSDQLVSMMEVSKRIGLDPEKNLNVASKYATFINDATGRGSVNIGKWKMERILGTLNDVFFAPKNMAGQIRTWNTVLNPYKYYQADPVMRKQALRSLLALAGLGLGVGEIARFAGAQVSNDPTNSDFRKIRIGDTRIDLFGGYQQFPVAAMRFIAGQSTSSISGETTDLTEGKFGRQTRATLAERFFTNRLSPLGSFIYSWLSTREFDGQPFEVKKALYERIFPIAAKDIVDLAQEDPWLAAMLAPSTLLGLTGTQHYSGRN